jgi:hypothetical protein
MSGQGLGYPGPGGRIGEYPDQGPRPTHSGLAIAAFVVSLIAFVSCWFPLVGLGGGIGAILGFIDLASGHDVPTKKGLSIAAVVLGLLAAAVGAFWIYLIQTSSCPHVYSFNGEGYVLDADPLSGSLFRGGEAADMDRLEELAAVDGEYRLRIANEREEVDFVNSVALRVVDHPETSEVLPTQDGEVLQVVGANAPVECTDGRGRDVLARLVTEDGVMFSSDAGDFSPDAPEEPRELVTCAFENPGGENAVLVLRGHNTEFGAEVFARYLAEMGSGVDELVRSMEDCDDYPEYIATQRELLGLGLDVEVWDGARWVRGEQLDPIGPAVLRSQAVRIGLPPGAGDQVRLRLGMAPLLWEIDQALLGTGEPVRATDLLPAGARTGSGHEARDQLLRRDEARVELASGEHVDLRFAAPPPVANDLRRTVILSISGYYDIEVGGWGWVNPVAMWRHQTSRDSLPRFALRVAMSEAEP